MYTFWLRITRPRRRNNGGKLMTKSKTNGRDLIKAVKPLLSDTPILNANIEIPIYDIGVLTVKFIVTPDILKAMAGGVMYVN